MDTSAIWSASNIIISNCITLKIVILLFWLTRYLFAVSTFSWETSTAGLHNADHLQNIVTIALCRMSGWSGPNVWNADIPRAALRYSMGGPVSRNAAGSGTCPGGAPWGCPLSYLARPCCPRTLLHHTTRSTLTYLYINSIWFIVKASPNAQWRNRISFKDNP